MGKAVICLFGWLGAQTVLWFIVFTKERKDTFLLPPPQTGKTTAELAVKVISFFLGGKRASKHGVFNFKLIFVKYATQLHGKIIRTIMLEDDHA
ncbi:predicted protein [Sclerotinia sclerotiorum 1980 UF-70]|uniref:Uncharacterized protein n=1 Tax=Sclerotinia sclerotiorum (strain ATCC 18683 / 1980 / Ss-1) TaxID=665079 RepID=A7EMF6_SCLS1|nr:predicted protein [Sclerotinia sclerotiorum 1980 UF-70]EDO04022.1 predicted protein [Sclerotinia sclerotiorum 1980 UF-70]